METDIRSLMLQMMTIAAVVCLAAVWQVAWYYTIPRYDVLTSTPHRTRFFDTLVILRLVSVACG